MDDKTFSTFLEGIKGLFSILIMFFSFPVEVLLRRNFGERYYKITYLIVMFVILNAVAMGFIGGKISEKLPMVVGNNHFLFFFTYVFLIAGIYHRYKIWNRNRKGQRWHSKAIGDPLPFFFMIPKMDKMRIHRFVEPLFVLAVAFVMSFIDSIFAIYLAISSLGLAFIANIMYKKFRNQQLDMIDAEIETSHLSEALEERPSKETDGFTLSGAKKLSPKVKERLASEVTKKNKIENAIETAVVNPLLEAETEVET